MDNKTNMKSKHRKEKKLISMGFNDTLGLQMMFYSSSDSIL